MPNTSFKYPNLGYGIGLRAVHYQTLLNDRPDVDWLEVMTEDYLVPGGRPLAYLERIRQHYPMVMHGVSLSVGSTDPLNHDYLKQIKQLADRLQPAWLSDHLCWTGINGINLHDLLPLPYTEEALQHVVNRVQQIQDILGRRILLENVSSYITYHDSSLTEWEFLAELANRADCLILLDINNIYVSAFNHQFDPQQYLAGIPADRVQQFHIAGHEHCGSHIIDTHDHTIIPAVWELYVDAVKRFGPTATLLERDDFIPELAELLQELQHAKQLARVATS